MIAGRITNFLLPRFGPRPFTTAAMCSGTIGFVVSGIGTPRSLIIGFLGYLPAVNGNGGVVVKSLATKHAVKSGMGVGEYSGQYANLRALVYVFGPMLFTR